MLPSVCPCANQWGSCQRSLRGAASIARVACIWVWWLCGARLPLVVGCVARATLSDGMCAGSPRLVRR